LVVEESGPVETEPDFPPPVENPAPVHDVAFEELQDSVDDWPGAIESGLPESVADTLHSDSGGLVAEQVPSHCMVPLPMMPQELLGPEQKAPAFGTHACGWFATVTVALELTMEFP
jgi:hypothetical protein